MANLSNDAQKCFEEAQELQTRFWKKLSELESFIPDIEVSGIEDLSTFCNLEEYVALAEERE